MKCPKCGGTNGYHFTKTLRVLYGGLWGEDAECVDTSSGRNPTTVVCWDCGKRISLRIASNQEKEQS